MQVKNVSVQVCTLKRVQHTEPLCASRYVLFENTGPDGYKARRIPAVDPTLERWPPVKMKGSPYSVITAKIIEIMQDSESACELHITGHR